MSGHKVEAGESSEPVTQTRCRFNIRVLLLLPVMIVLPIAVGELTNDLLWALVILLAEIVAAAIYPPTRILAALLVLLFLSLLLHSHGGTSEYAYRSQCANNLKRIALALHNYHDTYKCFPPAYVADEEGRPMHSWRVLILPYMEQQFLYDEYRFDEPWNGPNNRRLAGGISRNVSFCSPLRCPADPDGNPVNTNYVLVTGEGTAWADGRSPQLRDFTDAGSETIMVVEIANSNIHWMEPRDLTIDQAMRGINSPAGMCISAWHRVDSWRNRPESANVALVNGSVANLKNDFSLDELRKLLTYQSGEEVNRPEE